MVRQVFEPTFPSKPGGKALGLFWISLAIAVGIPALIIRFSGTHLGSVESSALFGIAIFGSAFLLSWASEVAEMDISQGLALALVALIAVLPEYAVDATLAWKAGQDPSSDYIHYATANMTGANRLLIGVGWAAVVFIYWMKWRKEIVLGKGLREEIVFLLIATLFSFVIPVFREIALWAAAVLILMFALYMWIESKGEVEHREIVGTAAVIGALPKGLRRAVLVFFYAYAALVIIMSAEPFAVGLISTGEELGIDKFILIQWVAPLASEAPELLVAGLFALNGNGLAALTVLVSSKVNQWTLLVGSLPVVYSISLGKASALAMDARQTEEFLLTAAQSLFAVVLLARMRIGIMGAALLAGLFFAQLVSTAPAVRYSFSFAYLGLAALLAALDWQRMVAISQMAKALYYRVRGVATEV